MINWGDVIVLAVLALIVGAVIGNMVRNHKRGKSCCCGSCKGCSMAGACGSQPGSCSCEPKQQ